MFYGGLKFQGGSRQKILEFLKQKEFPFIVLENLLDTFHQKS